MAAKLMPICAKIELRVVEDSHLDGIHFEDISKITISISKQRSDLGLNTNEPASNSITNNQ